MKLMTLREVCKCLLSSSPDLYCDADSVWVDTANWLRSYETNGNSIKYHFLPVKLSKVLYSIDRLEQIHRLGVVSAFTQHEEYFATSVLRIGDLIWLWSWNWSGKIHFCWISVKVFPTALGNVIMRHSSVPRQCHPTHPAESMPE